VKKPIGTLAAAAALALLASQVRAEQPAWLDVVSPTANQSVRSSVPLISVQGRVLRDGPPHALVIALDFSDSSYFPAGFDVDRDGSVGRLQPFAGRARLRANHRLSSDPHDTLAHASLALAREVIARLDPEHHRVALLTFAGHVRVRSELASPGAVLSILDRLELGLEGGPTDVAAVIRSAVRILGPANAASRSIVLISDGEATAPGSLGSAARRALAAAEAAARVGVRIVGVLPSRSTIDVGSPLARLARKGAGRVFDGAAPERWVHRLATGESCAIAGVEVRNATTGERGRAIRTFVDGSFDGLVTLVPGMNRIEIRARLDDGREIRERRRVLYEAPSEPSAEDAARTRALHHALRMRTTEMELALRSEPVRALRIEATTRAAPAATHP
jgi:hypothetical protein